MDNLTDAKLGMCSAALVDSGKTDPHEPALQLDASCMQILTRARTCDADGYIYRLICKIWIHMHTLIGRAACSVRVVPTT